jgi:hypothetical protein
MPKFDVTKLNVAVDRLLEITENPRHRFMLQVYARHRALEVSGRFEEIFAPDMMNPNPEYHFTQAGIHAKGQDAVKSLYRMWADTDQSIFYVDSEEVAVADHFLASVVSGYQQLSGKGLRQAKLLKHLPHHFAEAVVEKALAAKNWKADDDDMFLYKYRVEMIWPVDDRGRILGEDVYEPDPDRSELFKLDRSDVLTTEQAAKLLAPFIKPLPSFDEMVLRNPPPKRPGAEGVSPRATH